MKWLLFLLILTLAFLLFYLSWLPQPRLGAQVSMPGWLSRWTDENDNLRTAVPMVLMGFAGGFAFLSKKRKPGYWLLLWTCLTILVVLAELGQLYIPHRHFDWADIGWGTLGALAGLLLPFGLTAFRKNN